jgi:hypothetical protein
MTGVETFAWLVLAFADGSDCLIQASVHRLHDGPAFVREDGCTVHSQQEGSYVVFWSDTRWVAIKIPDGARSLSYRWGRAVAFVNGNIVKVQYGIVLNKPQPRSSMRERSEMSMVPKWRMSRDPSNVHSSVQNRLSTEITHVANSYFPLARAWATSARASS